MKDCLIYFVKYPTPGKVKTRLAQGSTPELAAEFYRAFAKEKLYEIAAGINADIMIFATPDSPVDKVTQWMGATHPVLTQSGDDLGKRMLNAFKQAFAPPFEYERAVLVGSDIPGLTPSIINEALSALSHKQTTLGPAEDGGYYLIGFHHEGFVPESFIGIDWNAGNVFAPTRCRLHNAGKDISTLPRLHDIDTIDDLRARAESNDNFGPTTTAAAKKILRG